MGPNPPKLHLEHKNPGLGHATGVGDVRKCGFAYFGVFSNKNRRLFLLKIAIARTRNRYFRFFSGSRTPKPYVHCRARRLGCRARHGHRRRREVWILGFSARGRYRIFQNAPAMKTDDPYFRFFSGSYPPSAHVEHNGPGAGPVMRDAKDFHSWNIRLYELN